MTFKFPTRRSARGELDVPDYFGGPNQAEPEEEPGIINGQKARSILEWRVAKALWKLKIEFFYQYPLFGGTQVRGGFVVDFLITGAPHPYALEVQGERWHTNNFASEERMREAMIEAYLDTEIRYVWEDQLQSDEDAIAAVKEVVK